MMMYESCMRLPCHAWDSAMAIWHKVSPRQKVCWVCVGQLVFLSLKCLFKLNRAHKPFVHRLSQGHQPAPEVPGLDSNDIEIAWHILASNLFVEPRFQWQPGRSVNQLSRRRWWREGFGYPGFLKGDSLSKTKPSGRWESVKCYQDFLRRDSDWSFILFILEIL